MCLRVCVCVSCVCGRALGMGVLCWGGVGCRWDLPLSVIEKCDLENVCPAEHESYLHIDGGVRRDGSPAPLTARALYWAQAHVKSHFKAPA